ncbi:TOM1-like protein 3 [Tasmannia lanceolata]|uniref:TOM1-like protein 3 n=1 Tax=Tasmannia lanceolata TaxID=3420 RepID=UPI004063A50B
MAANAASCVERATSDMLISPDWAMNIEICDIINMDPGQAKDAMKILKKRLAIKNPKIQLLALFVLETLSKNCGDNVHLQIVERDVLHEMVKIVKKKPDLNVREKILILIDTWQDAFGGPGGKYPQYYAAYHDLKSYGVEFPPRTDNTAPLFTPPQTQPIVPHHDSSVYEDAYHASLQSDSPPLSLAEIQNARGIADVLTEMLSALDPRNSEDLKQEVIIDLVDQCHTYQKRVMLLVNNTADEELLNQGLVLNDELQRVVCQYDNLVKRTKETPTIGVVSKEMSVAALVNLNQEDDESDDNLSQLARRSTRDNTHVQGKRLGSAKDKQTCVSPILPPPPSSKKTGTDSVTVDYLSGGIYQSERPSEPSNTAPRSVPVHPNSHVGPPPMPTLTLSSPPWQPNHVEPSQTSKSSPWEVQPSVSIPPPPSKYNQRQQFFEQHNQTLSSGTSYGSGSGFSYDGLVGQTQNLSIHPSESLDSSPPTRQTKPEDNLFKDLVDFAKAKSSPSAKPSSQRTL